MKRQKYTSQASLALTILMLTQVTTQQVVTTFNTTTGVNQTTSSLATSHDPLTLITTNQNSNSSQEIAANLTESLNERLVKQSNLQAEESQQGDEQAVFVQAPPSFTSSNQVKNKQQDQVKSTFVSGGSGNSYMSMSHDGSNRYDFGFDTSRKQQEQQQPQQTVAGKKAGPRLMREESRLEDGTVIGRYGYTDPFNVFRIVQYVAGPDGYFAAEDVGALEADPASSSAQSVSGSGPRFQLNKQLHRALDQARSLRKAHKLSSQKRSPQQRHLPVAANVQNLETSESGRHEEILSSSSVNHEHHQSVRFATRINHIIGNNGITYATAFRPTTTTSSSDTAPVAATTSASVWPRSASSTDQLAEQTQQASASKPVYVSMRYEPALGSSSELSDLYRDISTYDGAQRVRDLRSQLPAPIYSSSEEPLQPPAGYTTSEETHAQSVPSYYSHAASQPSGVLQSHPAWTLLNNNYNGATNFQTSVFIDHSQGAPPQKQYPAVGQAFSADAHREAQLLAALNERRPPAAQQVAVPQQVTPVVEQQQQHQQPQAVSSENANNFPFVVFGARTSTSTPLAAAPPAQLPSYNYGFALKHFDAPLYHPEVHETKPAPEVQAVDVNQQQLSVEPAAQARPSFSYATTVVHSEVAAEQAYKPERLIVATSPTQQSNNLDPLQRSASSAAAEIVVAPAQKSKASEETLLVRNERTEKIKRQEPLVAYATRLRAPDSGNNGEQAARAFNDEELSMADSEQVGYLPNGTHTSQLSRARLPDRTKKLSSIFKARHSQVDHHDQSGASTGGSGGGSSSTARIRRPVPVNAKKQFGSANSGSRSQPVLSAGADGSQESPRDKTTGNSNYENHASQATVPNEEPKAKVVAPSAAPQPPKVGGPTGKKFGANFKQQVPPVEPGAQSDDFVVEPLVPAKKRPLFVEPTARKQASGSNVADASAPADRTTSTSTSTTEAPLKLTTIEQVSSSNETLITQEPEAPQAVIVDATSGLATASGQLASSGANRELMEKIMRIQQELASKAAAAAANQLNETPSTSTTTTSTTTVTPSLKTEPQTSTTTEVPTTSSTTSTTSTTQAPTTTSTTPIPETQTTTTTTTPAQSSTTPTATTTTTSAPEINNNEVSRATKSVEKLNIISDNELTTTREQQQSSVSTKKLLTGPLVRMAASSSSDEDFMSSMTRDMMMPFDSARAVVMSNSSVKLAAVKQPAEARAATTPLASIPSTQASSLGESREIQDAQTHSTSDPASSAPSESPVQKATAKEAQPISLNETVEFTPSIPTTTTTTTTTQQPPSTTSALTPHAEVIAQDDNQRAATTGSTEATSQTTTTTTSTSTTAKPRQRQRTTSVQPARFGRLVIKRGDKVVARYNASDSIPDSMIPISGASGEIIMPDMPRLGMRRLMANKKRVSAQTANLTTSTTTTSRPATTTTTTVTPVTLVSTNTSESAKQLNRTDALSGQPELVVNSTTTITSAAEPKAAQEPARSLLARSKRKSLLRGARSPRNQAHSESEDGGRGDALLVEESAPQSTTTSVISKNVARRASRATEIRPSLVPVPVVSSSSTSTRKPLSQSPLEGARFGVRNSWSSRLKDNISRQMAAVSTTAPDVVKKYDPEEDLRKLVEKIERIQFESSPGGETQASAANAPTGLETPGRTSNQLALQIDLMSPQSNSSGRGQETTTVIPASSTQSPQQVATLSTSPTPNVTILQVQSNNGTLASTLANLNKSHNVSQSSSISFTLAVSPKIESQWEKLTPVNLTTNSGQSASERHHLLSKLITRIANDTQQPQQQAQKLAATEGVGAPKSSAPTTSLDIRMDSHGHIHVRNNQSITVHVDIEPPKRGASQGGAPFNSSSSTSAVPNKRISSRDTAAAVSALFGRDDIQRRAKQVNSSSSSKALSTNNSRASPENSPSSTTTTTTTAGPNLQNDLSLALLKRKPRMLCIEVESNDSDLVRQKRGDLGRLQTPRIAPDVAP